VILPCQASVTEAVQKKEASREGLQIKFLTFRDY
jgi:ABC-type metal ion transport system substrate-binding protein